METKYVVIRPSPEAFARMNEELGFTPGEVATWKNLRIKRRLLWIKRGKILKTIRQIDRSLAPMKNRGECPDAAIEERRKNDYELIRLIKLVWNCDGPIQLLEQKLEDALPGYAVASCQKITTGMSVLPRELRDIVYEHLLDDDKLRDFVHSYAEVLVKMPPAQRPYAMQSRLKFFSKPPHFMDSDIIGLDFASEIYIRGAEFVRKTPQSDIMIEPEEAPRFLTERIPGTEVSISSFFKSLELSIRPYTYFEGSDLGRGVFNSYCRKAIPDLGEARHENHGALRDLTVTDDEWMVFGAYFRRIIFDLAKAQQENGGVLHVTVAEGFIGYPWPRCRQIFQGIAGEVSRSKFGAIEIDIRNLKLVFALDTLS